MVTIDRHALEALLCKQSFYDFVQRFWSVIIPETPVWNWHIEYLCKELQAVAERTLQRKRKLYDLVINISPGTTKSTLCSIMYPAWCWAVDPTIRLICGSYSLDLGTDLAARCRNVIRSDKYRGLFPYVELVGDTKETLLNTRGGQRKTTSTGGTITGYHGHIIVIDDPINPKEAVSDIQLKAASQWLDHTLSTRKVDRRITATVMIMQRLHQKDPTGHILSKENGDPIRHICLPATLTERVKPESLKDRYIGGLFDPRRLSARVLEQAKVELGEYAYAGQFMQNPIPEGGGMFRIDQFRLIHSPSRLTQVVRYWDKAGTSKGGAWTVGVKMGQELDRTFVVVDVVRGQWEASERERIIKQTAQMDGRGVLVAVEQEPGSGGKESAQQTVKNLAGFRVRVDRPVGDKELRADPYAVQVNGGNVALVIAPWNRVYLDELQYFPYSTFKDQVDASSGAFAMLTRKKIIAGALK